jgi:hypothetical protein
MRAALVQNTEVKGYRATIFDILTSLDGGEGQGRMFWTKMES